MKKNIKRTVAVLLVCFLGACSNVQGSIGVDASPDGSVDLVDSSVNVDAGMDAFVIEVDAGVDSSVPHIVTCETHTFVYDYQSQTTDTFKGMHFIQSNTNPSSTHCIDYSGQRQQVGSSGSGCALAIVNDSDYDTEYYDISINGDTQSESYINDPFLDPFNKANRTWVIPLLPLVVVYPGVVYSTHLTLEANTRSAFGFDRNWFLLGRSESNMIITATICN